MTRKRLSAGVRTLRSQTGATTLEYALLLALIAYVSIASVSATGTAAGASFRVAAASFNGGGTIGTTQPPDDDAPPPPGQPPPGL